MSVVVVCWRSSEAPNRVIPIPIPGRGRPQATIRHLPSLSTHASSLRQTDARPCCRVQKARPRKIEERRNKRDQRWPACHSPKHPQAAREDQPV